MCIMRNWFVLLFCLNEHPCTLNISLFTTERHSLAQNNIFMNNSLNFYLLVIIIMLFFPDKIRLGLSELKLHFGSLLKKNLIRL